MFIAYALWFFLGGFGAHRIYCGKFFSGLAQLLLFWGGWATAWLIVGWVPLAIWGVWWLFDAFLTAEMVNKVNAISVAEGALNERETIEAVEKLYELYKSGAITKEEFERRKSAILH